MKDTVTGCWGSCHSVSPISSGSHPMPFAAHAAARQQAADRNAPLVMTKHVHFEHDKSCNLTDPASARARLGATKQHPPPLAPM